MIMYREDPPGYWREVDPMSWQEEHNWLARIILAIRGVGHCGRKGWRR